MSAPSPAHIAGSDANRPLDGQVAIVTGSGRGIGRAIAERLASHGARIVINGVDERNARATAEALDGETFAVPGDVTEADVPTQLVESAIARWGRLDIVVNNAGYNWDSPLAEMTDEQFHAMLDVHVMAPFRVLRAAAPFLLHPEEPGAARAERPQRKVVNLSSVSGTMGNENQANYNAGKAAIIGLSKGLAKEWGHHGVNVNVVAPGFIDTRLTALRTDGHTLKRNGTTIELGIEPSHRAKGASLTPLGRLGTPNDVADAVCFLCGPRSDYIHGQVISVTGGLTIGMEA